MKQKLQKKLKKSGGFTLVELLIVVAIIAILVAVSIPMVGTSLDKARTATDEANERAAKAAAIATYLLDEAKMSTGAGATYYYNAADGKIQSDKTGITGYNQMPQSNGSSSVSAKNGCVKINITSDGTATITWEAIS